MGYHETQVSFKALVQNKISFGLFQSSIDTLCWCEAAFTQWRSRSQLKSTVHALDVHDRPATCKSTHICKGGLRMSCNAVAKLWGSKWFGETLQSQNSLRGPSIGKWNHKGWHGAACSNIYNGFCTWSKPLSYLSHLRRFFINFGTLINRIVC